MVESQIVGWVGGPTAFLSGKIDDAKWDSANAEYRLLVKNKWFTLK